MASTKNVIKSLVFLCGVTSFMIAEVLAVPPVFTSSDPVITIDQNTTVGTVIYALGAIDPDLQGILSYGVSKENSSSASEGFFSVEERTGKIRVKKDLVSDPLWSSTYELLVTVHDTALPTEVSTAVVTIRVVRRPVFAVTQYALDVSKVVPVGSTLYQAQLVHTNNNITFSVEGTSPPEGSGFFSIYPDIGLLFVNKSLLETPLTQINLTVVATDNEGVPPGTATATVVIDLIGDQFAPVWIIQQFSLTLTENIAVGSTLVALRAVDADTVSEFAKVTYSLVSNHSDFFRMDENFLVVNRPLYLDPEKPSNYTLRVSARSLHQVSGQPATVIVSVVRNLHSPTFVNLPATVLITPSTMDANSTVYNVQAVDADFQYPFNVVRFSLAAENPRVGGSDAFAIDAVTGAVRTVPARLAADDAVTSYRLRVLAADGGLPSLVATGTLTVSVSREPAATTTTAADAGGGDDVGGIVGGVVGGVVVIALIAVAVWFLYKRYKSKTYDKPTRRRSVPHVYRGMQSGVGSPATRRQSPLPSVPVTSSSSSPSSDVTQRTTSGPAARGDNGGDAGEDHVYLEIVDHYDSLQPEEEHGPGYYNLGASLGAAEGEEQPGRNVADDGYEVAVKRPPAGQNNVENR